MKNGKLENLRVYPTKEIEVNTENLHMHASEGLLMDKF